jgi:hypothetical protein
VPIILATQEEEISRIVVQSQLGQIVWETLFRKNPPQKLGCGIGPEFKSQHCKKKKSTQHKKGVGGVALVVRYHQ